MAGISSKAARSLRNRKKYNGKEEQEEEFTDGSGLDWLDYGARMYDPQLGVWHNPDPLAEKFYEWSPYTYTYDEPVKHIDLDGRSGDVTLDKKNKTITVEQHFVFYGSKANSKLSGKIATGIASQWNGAHGKVKEGGVTYKVKFRITYETVSVADAKKMASTNKDIKNNFYRVEDLGTASSFSQVGGNAGVLNTQDDLGGSTTPSHEDGHLMGLQHTNSGQTPNDRPDIMTARNTQVNPRWSKVGPSNDIDPNFRRVNQQNISSVFSNVTFDANGHADIGHITNRIYDQNGN
ncbi:hypothetical protein GCM10023229_23950 [Flavisolibacter ginsenosidimutans]|uniref:RHS repeat-associated core domain-containing protein n=2 Tax=Flavisolibacter ginsenosidimutans TaxID=661481 RepID=A0A5B8ULR0_9BACT|nr:hypothetical protein FSB75_17410 [Flavisolibacter ginsenosidimutans]